MFEYEYSSSPPTDAGWCSRRTRLWGFEGVSFITDLNSSIKRMKKEEILFHNYISKRIAQGVTFFFELERGGCVGGAG